MPAIPQDEIERLKAEVGIEALVEASGVKLERRGQDLVGRCPFHDDKTPSLVITPSKNLWHCMGACNIGGDPIAWVMKREGVSFRHAVELLREDYAPSATAAPAKKKRVKLQPLAFDSEDASLLAEVVGYYERTLRQTLEALSYLEKRGLKHPDLIETFHLGYADRTLGLRLPQATRKAGAEIRGRLQAMGVIRESGHEHMRGSLTVPLYDEHGRVVNLYGRKIRDDLRKGTPNHLYLPGPQRGLFNRKAIEASEESVLCEALIDAMTFWCAGYRNVTSTFGAGGITEELISALQTHGTKRVLIAFDRDAAGDQATAALAERLAGLGIGAYRVRFPLTMDANDYALRTPPADRSLGAVLRTAEWMAGGQGKRRPVDVDEPLVAELVAAERDDDHAETAEEPHSPVAPSAPRPMGPAPLPEPTYAGPIPPSPPPPIDAEVKDREIVLRLKDRTWQVRGLHRNTTPDTLKVSLIVRRGEAFHADAFDLLSAKHRAAFVSEAAAELGLEVEEIKRDLGQTLLKLEALQDEALSRAEGAKPSVVTMAAVEEAEALAWLRSPDLLQRIATDVEACGVVGEAANAEAAYLAALSRKLDKPLACLIQSTSAAGKSALMDAVLSLAPQEEIVAYSAMTGQSLFYLGEADLKHKALAIAEEEGARHAAYALKLLQSQGALTIASTGKDPTSGKLVTQTYTVEGPVALMMTTTAIDLDEELRNRCLVLTIDESREQTRAIHARQRFEETLEGLKACEERARIVRLHQNAQRLLKPLRVVNPFAEHLTFQDDQTRTRRDHRKYLTLIRTVALLHQHQRPVRKLIRKGHEPVPYIEATLEDVAAANRLAHRILGSTLDELPPQTRRLLTLIHEMVGRKALAEYVKPNDVRFTRREVREATGWGDTQLRVHLGRLESLEYVLSRRDSGRVVYELAWSGEGQGGEPFVMGLIDVEALASLYDRQRAGQSEELAGGSRVDGGPSAAPSRPTQNSENLNSSSDFAAHPAHCSENARHRDQSARS